MNEFDRVAIRRAMRIVDGCDPGPHPGLRVSLLSEEMQDELRGLIGRLPYITGLPVAQIVLLVFYSFGLRP